MSDYGHEYNTNTPDVPKRRNPLDLSAKCVTAEKLKLLFRGRVRRQVCMLEVTYGGS